MFQLSSILCSDPKNVSLNQGVGNKIGQKWKAAIAKATAASL